MPESVSADVDEDVEHSDFGTIDASGSEGEVLNAEVVDAGSSDVEMQLEEEQEGIPEHQEVNSEVQEALDQAAQASDDVVQHENHREAVEAMGGGTEASSFTKDNATPEDFMMDSDDSTGSDSSSEAEQEETSTSDSNEAEDDESLPETTSEDIGLDNVDEDGEPDFSALKGAEQVTEEVTRNGQTFEFVFEEPEGSDDEIINMVRDLRGDTARNREEMTEEEEAEAESKLRKEAALKTITNYSREVLEDQWDDFTGSVKLQLGGRGLQVLGLMDFIRASGGGPEVQQGG